jgi:hypothetical protein
MPKSKRACSCRVKELTRIATGSPPVRVVCSAEGGTLISPFKIMASGLASPFRAGWRSRTMLQKLQFAVSV